MARGEVVVKITGDESGLRRSLSSSERGLKKFGGSAKKIGKGIGLAIGGAVTAVAVGVGAFAKVGFSELMEAENAAARTKNVIQTTGGAANVSAKHVESLANSIQTMTGQEDDAIQSGENMLLTFTNIRNGAGKNNDIFDQTTKIMADVSAAMGQDPVKAALQLGKALNDPAKGLTKLTRMGVTFSKEQQDVIKWTAASGDTMGAQRMILQELQKEFGGAATAAGSTLQGRINKLKRRFEDLAEAAVTRLIPVVEKLLGWLERLGDQMGPVFTKVSGGIEILVNSFGKGGEGSDKLKGKFQDFRTRAVEVWTNVKSTVQDAMNTIMVVINSVTSVILALWNNFGNNILSYAKAVFGPLQQYIRGVLQVIRGLFKLVAALIKGDWSGAWKALKEIVRGALNQMVAQVKIAFQTMKFIIGIVLEIIGSMIKGAWRAAWNETKLWFGKIVDFITGLPGKILGIVGAVAGAAKAVGAAIFNGIKNGLGVVGDLLRGLKDAFDRVILGPVRSGIHKLANALADVNIPGVGRAFDAASSLLNRTADAIHLAKGGIVKARPGGVFANIAEGGKDEVVAPLDKLRSVVGDGGVHIGTVVLGQGSSTMDLYHEMRWLQLTNGKRRGRAG